MIGTTIDGRIRPDSLLPDIPPGQTRIVGVFQRSITCVMGDVPVNLHRQEEAISPIGVWVPDLDPTAFSLGSTGTYCWPHLRLGPPELRHPGAVFADPASCGSGSSLALALHTSPDLAPPEHGNGVFEPRNTETIRKALTLFARPSEVTRCLWRAAQPESAEAVPDRISLAIATMRQRLTSGALDLTEFRECFGGGEGMTPAFDDFCTGLLLADVWISGGGKNQRKVQLHEAELRQFATRTTPVSFWQLRFASEGRSSLALERFMARLVAGDVSTAEVVRVMKLGHSSGSDILSGIWCRLQACGQDV